MNGGYENVMEEKRGKKGRTGRRERRTVGGIDVWTGKLGKRKQVEKMKGGRETGMEGWRGIE